MEKGDGGRGWGETWGGEGGVARRIRLGNPVP